MELARVKRSNRRVSSNKKSRTSKTGIPTKPDSECVFDQRIILLIGGLVSRIRFILVKFGVLALFLLGSRLRLLKIRS